MKGYKITVRETYQETYYIKAESEEAAEKLAKWEFGVQMAEDNDLLYYDRDVETEEAEEPEDDWLFADKEDK